MKHGCVEEYVLACCAQGERDRAGPLFLPDKNRYYEFTAAPRLRGIATITSSVVARVVGARTLVASVAAAVAVVVVVVVVTNHEFSCLSMIIYNQLSAVFDKLVARPIQSWRFDCKWTHVPPNIHDHSHRMLFNNVIHYLRGLISFFFFF